MQFPLLNILIGQFKLQARWPDARELENVHSRPQGPRPPWLVAGKCDHCLGAFGLRNLYGDRQSLSSSIQA